MPACCTFDDKATFLLSIARRPDPKEAGVSFLHIPREPRHGDLLKCQSFNVSPPKLHINDIGRAVVLNAAGGIRTHTVLILSQAPPTNWATSA